MLGHGNVECRSSPPGHFSIANFLEHTVYAQVISNRMKSVFRYRELVRNLVLKDLKLKYRDSVLGFIWSLANPLLVILVYSFVFRNILRGGTENFAYFLMVGILPWNFFAQSLMMSTGSILDNGSLIRKVALPMEVFPVATVLFNLAQFVLALIVFFPMALLFFKVSITWSWINFLPVLTLQILFTLGLSFIISAAAPAGTSPAGVVSDKSSHQYMVSASVR